MTAQQTATAILAATRHIALVGASPDPTRDSHRVMAYLLAHGFRVTPINPTVGHVLGMTAFHDLRDVDEPVDTVVCFRRSDAIEPIANSAIGIGAKHLWLQLGVVNLTAQQLAQDAGLLVVMNRCIMIDHSRSLSHGDNLQ